MNDQCLVWDGIKDGQGYGAVRINGRMMSTHRVSYELWFGEIPKGMQIDHLCRNRPCFNPLHLEAVTPRENVLRGDGIAAKKAAQTHCIYGHEFTKTNTYVLTRSSGHKMRQCRECSSLRYRKRAARMAQPTVVIDANPELFCEWR